MKRQLKKNSIRLMITEPIDGRQIFKCLIVHPMEDGTRRNRKTNKIIPPDYIEQFSISVDGVPYIELKLNENVSKNPFISCAFAQPVVHQQTMTVSWADNVGRITRYNCILDFSKSLKFRYSDEQPEAENIEQTSSPASYCRIPAR